MTALHDSPGRGIEGAHPHWRLILPTSLLLGLLLVLGPWAEAQASSVITHGPREQRWVALTFDDGWSADRCASIVRTLRAKRAPATFFINGAIIAGAPARWRAMLEGFSIANHTRTHPFLTQLGPGDIRTQIASNEAVIERALGRPMLKLLRPPYGAYDSQVVSIADSLGYRTILWDTSGGDTTSGATTSSVIRNAVRGGSGAVVLLHCGPSVTPAAVGPIIDSYRARGYRLVDLGQMLGMAAPPAPDACRVRNLDRGIARGRLGSVVRASRAGDHLTVRGHCRGPTVIDRDLRIRGVETQDSGPPTLDGSGRGTVVTVRQGASVVLAGLRIRGGAGTEGGGIRNAGTLALRDVVVRDSRARHGGGIWNRAGASLRLNGGTAVQGNTAVRDGGGVWNAGELMMQDAGAVRGNSATRAGGIWNDRSGALTLADGSAIRRNIATRFGGGVWTRGALVMLGSSAVADNRAVRYEGGGLYVAGGTLEGVICAVEPGASVRGNTPDQCFVVSG
jgi:peptidoglycan/xylan/chitin deacetylase (PgdA/CDA1 family)